MNEKNRRLTELDCLRGLAALSVVLYHYFYRYNEIYGHQGINVDWISWGKYGVNLFFVISGFVIFMTLNKIQKPSHFLIGRFSRLYPAYWASVLITFMWVLFLGLPGREVDWVSAVANVLMFQSMLGIDNVDGVYWTLVVELKFYVIAFMFYFFNRLPLLKPFLLLLTTLYWLELNGIVFIPKPIQSLMIIKFSSYFFMGVCFYDFYLAKEKKHIGFLAISLLMSILIVGWGEFIMPIVIFLIFILSINRSLPTINNNILLYLGGISYSLYLLHQNIGYSIIINLKDMGFNTYLTIFSALLVSILLSAMVNFYIEKPSLNYLKKKLS